MLGTFIDTIVVCTMTALVILTSGAWVLKGKDGPFDIRPTTPRMCVGAARERPAFMNGGAGFRGGIAPYVHGPAARSPSFRRMPESSGFSFLLCRFRDRPAMFLSSSALANLSVVTRIRRNEDQRWDTGKAGFATTTPTLLNRFRDYRPPP